MREPRWAVFSPLRGSASPAGGHRHRRIRTDLRHSRTPADFTADARCGPILVLHFDLHSRSKNENFQRARHFESGDESGIYIPLLSF